MKPWDTLRREILGVWRSVRYDLDHRDDARESGAPAAGETDSWYSDPLPERESGFAQLRDPRRVVPAVGVASVIAASATGTYFAVAGALGLVFADAAGVPVSPQAVAPLMPGPHAGATGASAKRDAPVDRTNPSESAHPSPTPSPTAPIVEKSVEARPTRSREATSIPTMSHIQAPGNTPSVTPSNSPSPSPSPTAPEPSTSPLSSAPH